jgi:hypothetical protein
MVWGHVLSNTTRERVLVAVPLRWMIAVHGSSAGTSTAQLVRVLFPCELLRVPETKAPGLLEYLLYRSSGNTARQYQVQVTGRAYRTLYMCC